MVEIVGDFVSCQRGRVNILAKWRNNSYGFFFKPQISKCDIVFKMLQPWPKEKRKRKKEATLPSPLIVSLVAPFMLPYLGIISVTLGIILEPPERYYSAEVKASSTHFKHQMVPHITMLKEKHHEDTGLKVNTPKFYLWLYY